MQKKNLVAINEFCINHNIEISFINTLQQTGLIQITNVKESVYIDANQLKQLEKFVHFYYELDINLEGIETITQLLQRNSAMQDEITELQNRLRIYEPE